MKYILLLCLGILWGLGIAGAHDRGEEKPILPDQEVVPSPEMVATQCPAPVVEAADLSFGQEVASFFPGLLDTQSWPARWYCGTWSPFLGWLYIASDILIWMAYFAIPVILFLFVYRRGNDIPFRTIFLWFIGFILACGLTHLIDAAIFWWPAYRLSAFVKFVTAFVSLGTVFALTRVIPHALELQSPASLEKLVQQRTLELQEANQQLAHQIEQRNKADEEVRRLNRSLFDFQHAVDIASIVSRTDPRGVITFVNDNFVHASGYSRSELVGQNHRIINGGHHDPSFWADMWKTIAAGNIWRKEVKNQAKNGHYYWGDTLVIPFLNDKGDIAEYLSITNDITDRKLHEEQLHFQARLLENVSDAIIVTDDELTITHWNAAAEMLYGCEATYAIGKPISKVLKADHPADNGLDVTPWLKATGHWQAEVIHQGKAPTPLHIHTSVSRVIDSENHQKGIVYINRDITQQKVAEEALRESEERFRNVVDNLSEGLILFDDIGQFLHWNKAALAMHGFASEEECYQQLPEFEKSFALSTLAGAPLSLERWPLNHLLDHGAISNMEVRIRHLQQQWTRIFCYGGGSVVSKDGASFYFLTIDDITERKNGEIALQESESRLQQLIASLPQLVWTCQPDGQCDFLSEQWVTYTGIPAEEQLGFRWLEQIHPDDRETTIARWNHAVENDTNFRVEFRIRSQQGVYQWFDTIATKLYDGEGQLVKWFGSNTNIEEKKKATLEIERLNSELEARVVERTKQLEVANRELEAFSYSVSHDLRAPLRHIHGYSDILLENHQGQLDEDGKKVLGVVKDRALKMGNLIDDLLEFSRLGRRTMKRQSIRSTALVEEVYKDLIALEPKRTVHFTIHPLEDATGDFSMIKQVWMNLIANAIKYTRYKEPAVIEVRSSLESGEVRYFIKDNGTGFDMQHVDKLFNVFQRLHKDADFEGTGVGLALVKRIVQRHGGQVGVEAEKNQGATFYFTLPLIQ